MLFSSSVFLFAYLPIVLAVYYIPLRGLRRAQNLFLLAASLLFYAWGEPWFVLVMAASIAANYGFGLWVHARLCRCRSVRLPWRRRQSATWGCSLSSSTSPSP